jgi:hypothetical protein
LRQTGEGGRILVTAGIAALNSCDVASIRAAIAAFDDFEDGNDPHGEHDFGAITVAGEPISGASTITMSMARLPARCDP